MSSLRIFGLSALAAFALATTVAAQPSGLTDLHDALGLSPAQASAWGAFEASTRPDPEQAARRRATAQMLPTLHAPQRVDLSVAAMQADLQTLQSRGAALKTFYATLSPAQQAIFDQKTAQRPQ